MATYNKEVKLKAISLREKGYSIREISQILGIAKSTASLWVIHTKLDIKAVARLQYGLNKGRRKGISNRQLKLSKIYTAIHDIVQFDVDNVLLNVITKRLLCSFLYWGEGAKTGREVRIINSDPVFIQAFLILFRSSFKINEQKFGATLHLHNYHDQSQQLQFW